MTVESTKGSNCTTILIENAFAKFGTVVFVGGVKERLQSLSVGDGLLDRVEIGFCEAGVRGVVFLVAFQSVIEIQFCPIRTTSPYCWCTFMCVTWNRRLLAMDNLQRWVNPASHGPI